MSDDRVNLPLDANVKHGGLYILALGAALLLFGRGSIVVLPSVVLDWLFPISILPPERLVIALIGKFSNGLIAVDALSDFIKQFFVLSILFFFVSLLIITLQARAHAFYADPLQQPTIELWKGLLVTEPMRFS